MRNSIVLNTRSGSAPSRASLEAVLRRAGVTAEILEMPAANLRQDEKFETWLASSITLETSPPRVAVALDGELSVLDSPRQFQVLPRALTVILPAPEAA